MASSVVRKVDEVQQIDENLDDDGFSKIRRRFQELNIRELNIDAELAAIKRRNRSKKQTKQDERALHKRCQRYIDTAEAEKAKKARAQASSPAAAQTSRPAPRTTRTLPASPPDARPRAGHHV